MLHQPTKFNFFVPAEFTKSGETGEMVISGVCSSKTEDTDGETLDPAGFDFAPLLEKGYFNWNHQANKTSSAILGRPTSAKVINGGQDFFVEGKLYKGLEEARAVYNLAKTLENEDPTRRLGFSIEGHATDRDPINPKRIRKATITGIAITHCPKNANTLLNIMKGEYQEPFVEVKELEEVEVLNNDIEKGGHGSGRKLTQGSQVYYNKTIGGVKHNLQGKHLESDSDGKYHHIRSTTGDLHYVPSSDITHHDFGQGKVPFNKSDEEVETEKSMDSSSTPLPESVEGTPKPSLKTEQEKNLEKGGDTDHIIGITNSGKNINYEPLHEDHKVYTQQDHVDAAKRHEKYSDIAYRQGKGHEIVGHHDSAARYHWKESHKFFGEVNKSSASNIIKSEENESEKGNAKQSERVVGKTRSGKEVYESTGHKSHYAFDKDDHEDASNLHLEEAGMLWKLGKKDEAFSAARRAENHKTRAKKAKSGEKTEVKKSEIFDQIFKNYTQDIEKSEKIYKFIQSVNEKTNPMPKEITEDVLNKAFELLDESILKSESSDVDDKDKKEDYDKKDELMKDGNKKKPFDKDAEEDAKSQIKDGKKEDEVCDDMMAKGYDMAETQTAVAKLCAEYTASKDGDKGTGTPVTVDGIKKGEEVLELLKITESFEKSQTNLVESLDKKFSALTTILKSQIDRNIEFEKSLVEIKEGYEQSLGELKKSIETIDKPPYPRKTVTSLNVLEKFQKSEGADKRQLYRLGDPTDRANLVNVIFQKAQEAQQLGRPNEQLEKAVSDLEISKSMHPSMLPILNSWGIQIAE